MDLLTKEHFETNMNLLAELFEAQLCRIYYAEKEIVKALPKMARASNCEGLKVAFIYHISQTADQIEKLERVFDSIGRIPRCVVCDGVNGMLAEGNFIMKEFGNSACVDAALICVGQKIEHYEIATYGCLITWAKILEYDLAAKLLAQILDQEEVTDRELTDLAEYVCNGAAETEAA